MANKLPCGCTPDASGYGYCYECTRKLRDKIWREMPEEKKRYDRHFDPIGSRELDDRYEEQDPSGCSCHINPPCSYCTREINESEEKEAQNG